MPSYENKETADARHRQKRTVPMAMKHKRERILSHLDRQARQVQTKRATDSSAASTRLAFKVFTIIQSGHKPPSPFQVKLDDNGLVTVRRRTAALQEAGYSLNKLPG